MPPVPLLRPRDVVSAFHKLGWEVARQRGSHIILTKTGHPQLSRFLTSPNVALGALALPECRFSGNLQLMEVQFTPETEKKLKELAAASGRRTDDLVEDAMAGYVDELIKLREMLNRRYDDLKSGRVKPIPGDEVEAHFRRKSAAAR